MWHSAALTGGDNHEVWRETVTLLGRLDGTNCICFKKFGVTSVMHVSFEKDTGFCINKELCTVASG